MAGDDGKDEVESELDGYLLNENPVMQDVTHQFQIVQANDSNIQVATVPADKEIIDTGLLKYLENKTEGKSILKHYKLTKEKKQPLSRNFKNRLVRLVITREKDCTLKHIKKDRHLDKLVIVRARFEKLAKEIEQLFKYESAATYFLASEETGNGAHKVHIHATGKLWNNYNYSKKKLRDDHMLLGKPSGNRFHNILSNEELETVTDDNVHIDWLSINLDPWNEVFERWVSSYDTRRKILTHPTTSIFDYMNKFPCLKNQEAKELFTSDFELLHPEKEFISPEKWKSLKVALIDSIKENAKMTNLQDSVLLGILTTGDLAPCREDFIVFYLLCYLIKPKRAGKRKRDEKEEVAEPRKLSIQERRESFILRVEASDNIEVRLREFKERCMQDGETFQPLIVAVGPPNHITKFHVVVNEQLFDVDSVLEAIELTLKIFFALDCRYPSNTKTVWVFLQKILLGIDLPDDEVTIDGNALIGHLRKL